MGTVMTPYDKILIKVGSEEVYARPIEWDGEIVDAEGHKEDGEMAVPTMYESSCPDCSQMVIFKTNHKSVKCPHCGSGEDVIDIVEFPEIFQEPEPLMLGSLGQEDLNDILDEDVEEDELVIDDD